MDNPQNYIHSNCIKNTDIEDIYKKKYKNNLSKTQYNLLYNCLHYILNNSSQFTSYKKIVNYIRDILKKNKIKGVKGFCWGKSHLLSIYLSLINDEKQLTNNNIHSLLIRKPSKTNAGVVVITVLTSPTPQFTDPETKKITKQRFSCKWNCYYCPNEPGQPRSYLYDEPSVIRANNNNFDPILQFTDRANTLHKNGHPIDKIEIIILGGTWHSYPIIYRREFLRDIYYAANTFQIRQDRPNKNTLDYEKNTNTISKHRIIGVTIETRPDCINIQEILELRRVGCTRIQLGIQHTNDDILKKINRDCKTNDVKKSIKLLLDHGFKIDGHLMTQLPNASVIDDYKMFYQMLYNCDLRLDQWKIYPCEVVPWTVIKKWFNEGSYKPYSESELIQLLLWLKPQIHPWIRINRIVRDIPSQYIIGQTHSSNFRETLDSLIKKNNIKCGCIRCREIKGNIKQPGNSYNFNQDKYISSDGNEIFISCNTTCDKQYLLGFLRLRLPNKITNKCSYPLLKKSSFIRELHVYGPLIDNIYNFRRDNASQHIGIGSQLIKIAEKIALQNNYQYISIIAGVGTRNYYAKRGYNLTNIENGEMMIKQLNPNRIFTIIKFIIYILIILYLIFILS